MTWSTLLIYNLVMHVCTYKSHRQVSTQYSYLLFQIRACQIIKAFIPFVIFHLHDATNYSYPNLLGWPDVFAYSTTTWVTRYQTSRTLTIKYWCSLHWANIEQTLSKKNSKPDQKDSIAKAKTSYVALSTYNYLLSGQIVKIATQQAAGVAYDALHC